jgi:hypothetical protein
MLLILVANHIYSGSRNALRPLLIILVDLYFQMAPIKLWFDHISVCEAHIDLILVSTPMF